MPGGQNLGGIFVSIGLDLRNVQSGVVQAAKALKGLEDVSKGISLSGPDVSQYKEVQNTLNNTARIYKEVVGVITNFASSIKSSMTYAKTAMSSVNTTVMELEINYDRLQRTTETIESTLQNTSGWAKWGTAMKQNASSVEFLRNQVARLKTNAEEIQTSVTNVAKSGKGMFLVKEGEPQLTLLKQINVEMTNGTVTSQRLAASMKLWRESSAPTEKMVQDIRVQGQALEISNNNTKRLTGELLRLQEASTMTGSILRSTLIEPLLAYGRVTQSLQGKQIVLDKKGIQDQTAQYKALDVAKQAVVDQTELLVSASKLEDSEKQAALQQQTAYNIELQKTYNQRQGLIEISTVLVQTELQLKETAASYLQILSQSAKGSQEYIAAQQGLSTVTTQQMGAARVSIDAIRKAYSVDIQLPTFNETNYKKGLSSLQAGMVTVEKDKLKLDEILSKSISLDIQMPAVAKMEAAAPSLQKHLADIVSAGQQTKTQLQSVATSIERFYQKITAAQKSGKITGTVQEEIVKPPIPIKGGVFEQGQKDAGLLLATVKETDKAASEIDLLNLVKTSTSARDLASRIVQVYRPLFKEGGGEFAIENMWKELDVVMEKHAGTLDMIKGRTGEVTAEMTVKYNAFALDLTQALQKAETQLKQLSTMTPQILSGIEHEKISFKNFMPDEGEIEALLKTPFEQVDNILVDLQAQLQETAKRTDIFKPDDIKNMQETVGTISNLRSAWSTTAQELKGKNLGEILRSSAGSGVAREIITTVSSISQLLKVTTQFGTSLQTMNLKEMFKGIWTGTEAELRAAVTSFRSAADGIGSNWEQIKQSTKTAVGAVKGSMKEFTKATLDIPTVGAPGMELFVTTVQDMKKLGVEVQKNAAEWRRLNLELNKTAQLDTSTWAEKEIANQQRVIKSKKSTTEQIVEATLRLQELQDPSKLEGLYRQEIINLEQKRDATGKILQEQYNQHREYIAKLEYAYKELAFNTARQMTQQIQYKPIQTGMKVGEFEQEAMISNSKSIQDLKYQLESLHSQEILNIQTEKSRAGELQKLNEIVERAVPLTAGQVEEMVRLAMSVDNAKVRFDALETIMNKIAQITSSKIILGDKFNAATEYMKLFEAEAQKVTGILGQLGMGMDASGMKVVNAIAGMNAIMSEIPPKVLAMRAAFSNINIVLEQHKQGIGVSKDSYAAMMSSINALTPSLRTLLLNFAGLNEVQTPKSLGQMLSKLLELMQQGIEPTTQKLKEFYATASQELAVDVSIQKMKVSVTELAGKIETLTLTYKSGAATLEQMIQLYSLLEQQKLLMNTMTTKEVVLMQQLSQHIMIASQNVTQFANIQNRLMTEVAPLQAMGQTYEANKLKLDILTQSLEQHIRTLSTLKAATEGVITVDSQYGTGVEKLTQSAKETAASYKLVTEILLKFKAAAAATTVEQGVAYTPIDLSGTIQQAMTLRDLFSQIGVVGMQNMGKSGAAEWAQLFQQAEQKLGISVNKMLTDLDRLKKEQAIKFAPEIESGKISSEVDQLTNRLMQLENAERVLGSSQNRVNEIIQVRTRLMELMGARTTQEIAIITQYAQRAAILGTELQKLAEIETQLAAKAGIPHEALGRSYDAQIAKIDVFKNSLRNEALVLDGMGISLNKVTEAEIAYKAAKDKNIEKREPYLGAMRQMEQVGTTISGAKTEVGADEKVVMTDTDEITKVIAQVDILNTKLMQLRLTPIKLNTKDLGQTKEDMARARQDIVKEVKAIQGETQKALGKFTVDIKMEGLKDKEAQIVQDVTDNLKVLGAEQLVAGHSTEFHNKRVQELNKAFVASKNPIQAAQQFLRDEVALGKQRIAQLDQEIAKSPLPIIAQVKHGMETAKLNKNQLLLNRTMEDYSTRLPEQAKLINQLTGYVKEQSIESGRSAGRYKGVAQAIQGFTQDIKNLIQVQIRWYVTQALIFNTFYMLRNAITFYMDLEKQVRRVSSALAHQYNIAAINEKIMSVLTKEMVRTGMAAQDLATILWELVSAGLSQQEAMAGVEHINNLAMGSELELSEATRIAAGLFRIFGEEIAQAGSASDKWRYIVDRLSATLNQSQVDMSSLTAGLSYMVNESDTAGISFELMLSILSVLNNRMLMGSKAGRSASRVLSQLTGNAKELSKSFGIQMDMSKPLDLLDVLEKMSVVLERNKVNGQLTAGMFDKLQDVFGQVGKRAAIGLIENLDELKDTMAGLKTDKFNNFAKKMADIKLDSLSKQLAILSNSFQLLMSQGLAPLSEMLRIIVDNINRLLKVIGVSNEVMEKTWLQTFIKITLQASLVYTVLKGVAWLLRGPIGGASVFGALGLGITILLSLLNSLLLNIPKVVAQLIVMRKVGLKVGEMINYIIITLSELSNYQKIGIVFSLIVAAGYLINRYLINNTSSLRENNTAVEASIEAYKEAEKKYIAVRDTLKEVSDQYNDAIPYTKDWYRLREQINQQYPRLLEYMDVEKAVTGKMTNALEDYLVKKREELELDQKKIKIDNDLQIAAEKSAKTSKSITDKILPLETKQKPKFWEFGLDPVSVGKMSAAWALHALGIRQVNKESIDLTQTTKLLLDNQKELPLNFVLLARSFDTIRTKTSAILDLSDAFERVGGSTGIVRQNLIDLIDQLEADYNINLGDIKKEISIHPVLEPGDVEKIIEQLRSTAKAAIQESVVSSTTLDEIITRVKKFNTEINSLSATVSDPVEIMRKFEEEVVEINKRMPPEMSKLLSQSGADLNAIYRKGIEENKRLIEAQEGDENKARYRLMVAQQAVETFLSTINTAQASRVQSTILNMDKELGVLGNRTISRTVEMRTRLSAEFEKLTSDEKQALISNLKDTSELFLKFLDVNSTMTADQLGPVYTKLHEIAERTKNEVSKETLAFFKIWNDNIHAVEDFNKKIGGLAATLAGFGTTSGEILTGWIKENRDYIAEVMSYLPSAAQKMMEDATVLEQLQIIKEIEATRILIQEEIGKLGISVSEPIKIQIAFTRYNEMFEKFTFSSKKFNEEQIKASDELTSRIIKNMETVGTTYSTIFEHSVESLHKKIAIEDKYNKEFMRIEKEKETLKMKEFSTGEDAAQYDKYTKLAEGVKKYEVELKKVDTTIQHTTQTQTAMNRVSDIFTQNILGTSADTELSGVLVEKVKEIKDFVDSQNELIVEEFENFEKQLAPQQQDYMNGLVDILVKEKKLDIKDALLAVKTVLKSLSKGQYASFSQGVEEENIGLDKILVSAEGKRKEIMTKMILEEIERDKILKNFSTVRLQNTKAYQDLELREKYLHLQKGLELDAIEETNMENKFNRIKYVQNRAITDLERFMKSYDSVISFKEFAVYLKKRLEAEAKLFTTEAEQLRAQIDLYKREADRFIPVISQLQERMRDLNSKKIEAEYSPIAASRIDRLGAENFEIFQMMLDLDEKIRNLKDDAAKLDKQRDSEVFYDIQSKIDNEEATRTAVLKRQAENANELNQIRDEERKKDKQRTQDQLDLVKGQRGTLVTSAGLLTEELAALPEKAAAQFTQMGMDYGKRVMSGIKDYIAEHKLEIQARFQVGGGDIANTQKIVDEEFKPEFEEIQREVQKISEDALEKVATALNLTTAQKAEARFRMSQAFTEIITGGFGDVEGVLRTFISDTSSAILGDISVTKPLLPMELKFSTVGIGQTKQEVSELYKFSEELLQIEKAAIPVLQRKVTYYRQQAQEAVKAIPAAEGAVLLALREEKIFKDIVKHYKDMGMEEEATQVTQNELVIATDRRVKAEQKLDNLQAGYKDNLGKYVATSKQLEETTNATASTWQKMKSGVKSAWDEFKKGAQDAKTIMNDLTNVVLEGFSTAMSDTMTAIFQPPAQEIEDAKAELDDLYKQKKEIAEKMKLIEAGEVLASEREAYQDLQKQLKDVNRQLEITKGNLDDLKNTAKRVGEAFRQFGMTILDALQQIIAKLIVVNMFEAIGLGSLFGLEKGGIVKGGFKELAKGGIVKGGFKKFATGGIAEGGFTALDKTQKASWTPFLQNMMKAKFLQSGGVARGPMLGVIGEGSRNEAVVPLPDNKSIPVSFTNDKKTQSPPQDVKIVNLIDPKMIPSIMLQYPEAILNVISEDVLKRGPIYQLLRKV